MNKDYKRLPDGELEIMQILWNCSIPAYRSDIEAQLSPEKHMAQTTLLTFLTRLAEKGFIKIEKTGRQSCYTPLVSRHDYLAAQSRNFVNKICGGSMSAFASALCDSGLSREEIEELRRLLKEESL